MARLGVGEESFNVLVREMQSLCLDVVKLVKVEGAGEVEVEEEEVVQPAEFTEE